MKGVNLYRRCTFLFLALASVLTAADQAAPLDFNLYMEGKYVYERNCIVCHGPRGDGTGEMSAQLQPKPRSFREGMFKFRSTPAGMLPTEADLARTIRGGLSGTGSIINSGAANTLTKSGMTIGLGSPELRRITLPISGLLIAVGIAGALLV